MRDLRDLIGKGKDKPKPTKLSADEFTRLQYEQDLARLWDFSPPGSRLRWPKPIGPLWKN